jgi:uncharacterized membrane protein
MAIVTDALARPGLRSFSASLDLEAPVEEAFALLCSVEKWPVWLSFLRSARAADPASRLAVGSEVILRSNLPGDEEQLFEVDQLIRNYHLSLVGAYSVRRRLDFRIERKTSFAKLHVRLTYPNYGGRFGALMDHVRNGRRMERVLGEALEHFRGLIDYRSHDGILGEI